jgi:hypothetical protein
MAKDKLRSFHLTKKNDKWRLEQAGSDRALRSFDRKEDALKGGAIKGVLGKEGGSVKIHKENGRIQQERTYPRKKDPKGSKG